jgi:Domain of unknown function (DUF4145)
MPVTYNFQREILEKPFFTDKHPMEWKCGVCGAGQLITSISNEKPARSQKTRSFSCKMRCTNKQCQAEYALAGRWGKFNDYGGEISMEYIGRDCERRFLPLFFHPALFLFQVPELLLKVVYAALEDAFRLFWAIPAACAGAIRKLVEVIMAEKGFTKGTLHQRIEAFGKSDPQTGKYLEAVKWIGNAGSHETELQKTDVLDAFEMLAEVLSALYPDVTGAAAVEKMADEINAKKNVRSKK